MGGKNKIFLPENKEKNHLLFRGRYGNLYKSEKEKESRVSTLTLAQLSD